MKYGTACKTLPIRGVRLHERRYVRQQSGSTDRGSEDNFCLQPQLDVIEELMQHRSMGFPTKCAVTQLRFVGPYIDNLQEI